jgi:prophage regulatory protein
MNRLIRQTELTRITGLSRCTISRLEEKGLFPPRRKIGEHAVGWLEKEIMDWIQKCPLAMNVLQDSPATNFTENDVK